MYVAIVVIAKTSSYAIRDMLREISTLTTAQNLLETELSTQKSTLQLQQAAIENLQRQNVKNTGMLN